MTISIEPGPIEPVPLSQLAAALDVGEHELIALVGGGGKTTSLFALGQQLGGTVVLTTTTKMSRDRTDGLSVLVGPTEDELRARLRAERAVLVWRDDAGDKAIGVAPETCERWFDLADHVVVEADGSRQRPVTAPSPFEPVVPSRTTMLLACVGASAFGRVIADRCHRPMRVAAAAGCSPYQRLTAERLATLLLNDRGLRKALPPTARFAVLVGDVQPSDRPFLDDLAAAIGDRAPIVAVQSFR